MQTPSIMLTNADASEYPKITEEVNNATGTNTKTLLISKQGEVRCSILAVDSDVGNLNGGSQHSATVYIGTYYNGDHMPSGVYWRRLSPAQEEIWDGDVYKLNATMNLTKSLMYYTRLEFVFTYLGRTSTKQIVTDHFPSIIREVNITDDDPSCFTMVEFQIDKVSNTQLKIVALRSSSTNSSGRFESDMTNINNGTNFHIYNIYGIC